MASMEDLMKSLAQTAVQQAQTPAGQAAISQAVGSLLGGSQQGAQSPDALAGLVSGFLGGGQQAGAQSNSGQPAGQILGLLEQVIGGAPGSGNLTPGGGMSMGANDPMMLLLQPVVNQLAAKANIQPEIATVVVSLVIHYLLSNHPSSGRGSTSLDLNSVFKEMSSGGVSQSTLHSSGMVNDVMQATGLSKDAAVKSLDTTFNVLSGHAQGKAGISGRSAK